MAHRLGRPFIDFDREIERRAGKSIADIFRDHGEPHFRDIELDITQELVGTPGAILAPGGGWITVPGALALLRPPARMIYLRVTPEVAILRMGKRMAVRPLLTTADPAAELARLLSEREAAYSLADWVIDANVVGVEALADALARLVLGSADEYV